MASLVAALEVAAAFGAEGARRNDVRDPCKPLASTCARAVLLDAAIRVAEVRVSRREEAFAEVDEAAATGGLDSA